MSMTTGVWTGPPRWKGGIVTGASSGFGCRLRQGTGRAGADLVLAARRADRLEHTRALVEERGRRALTVTPNVARPETHKRGRSGPAEFGHVDVLVNNAGKGTAVPHPVRTTRAIPRGDRHQPQRVLLDGAGLRAGHEAGSAGSSTCSVAARPAAASPGGYSASKAG